MSFVVSSCGAVESDLRFMSCPSGDRIIWSHNSVLCRSCVKVNASEREFVTCVALLLCVLDAYLLRFGNLTQVTAYGNSNLPKLFAIFMFLHDLRRCVLRDAWSTMSGSEELGSYFV